MNTAELRAVVLSALSQVAPEIDVGSVEADVDLHEQLDIDSMDFLNFVIGLDESTGVDIPERDYSQLRTLNGCIEYLRSHAATR